MSDLKFDFYSIYNKKLALEFKFYFKLRDNTSLKGRALYDSVPNRPSALCLEKKTKGIPPYGARDFTADESSAYAAPDLFLPAGLLRFALGKNAALLPYGQRANQLILSNLLLQKLILSKFFLYLLSFF